MKQLYNKRNKWINRKNKCTCKLNKILMMKMRWLWMMCKLWNYKFKNKNLPLKI